MLLTVVVLAVLVSAGLEPRRVAGSPQTVFAPGPPSVGDCVTDPVNPDSWSTAPYDYPRLRFEACEGYRFGEVIAVLANPATLSGTTARNNGSAADRNSETCYQEWITYLGADTKSQYWGTRVYAFTTLASPSPLQQAVGQHWLACAMFIPGNDAQTAVAHYRGSLRNAFVTGNVRELLGFCGSGRDWTTGYVSACSSPHEFQVLASGVVGGGDVSRDELQRTCVQVAQRLTALPDVTAAGALAVEVKSIENTGASYDWAGVAVPAKFGCGISTVGNRRLAGSLVARGDHPLPWA